MNKIAFVVFIFGVLISSNLKAETVLYCQDELATGFLNEGSWNDYKFRKLRYTIKFKNDYSILEGLKPNSPFSCITAYDGLLPDMSNTFICMSDYSNGTTFIFDKSTGRYVYFAPNVAGGYTKNGNDTTNMYAGTCEKF